MQQALDDLRAKLAGDPIDFAELLILGARAKARGLQGERDEAQRACEELAEWIRTGEGPELDIEAAEEVKRLGLIANYDE